MPHLRGVAPLKFIQRLLGGQQEDPPVVLSSTGHCPICDGPASFAALDPWLRDHFLCAGCGSIPRERALMRVIETVCPDWREQVIHESSPSPRGASQRLAAHCAGYIGTQFFPGVAAGTLHNGVRCENLEAMTFVDNSVGLHVTQDVIEHVFDPAAVFREIARTLKPGGAHICTVPLVNRSRPSQRRARLDDRAEVVHLLPPVYHGNPISEEGALVTMDWGFDIGNHIFDACGLPTRMFVIDDLQSGIRADLIEVLVTIKPSNAA